MRIVLALAVSAALVSPSEVGVSQSTYKVMGAGNSSCGRWTADHRYGVNPVALNEESWVVGFLSGIGDVVPDANPLGGTDLDGVTGWIGNYCAAHPLISIFDAAIAFYRAHPRP